MVDTTVSRFLKKLFAVLNSNKIEYVILRGYKGLPECIQNDVDFFVSPDSLSRFVACLLGVSEMFSAKVEVVLIRQGVIKCVVKSPEIKINIDFWYNLTFWGLSYSDRERLLSKRMLHSSGYFYTPDPLAEFEISFLKEIFHNQKIRCDKINELSRLLENSIFDNESFIGSVSNKASLQKIFSNGCGKKYLVFVVFFVGMISWNMRRFGVKELLMSIYEFIATRFSSLVAKKIKHKLMTKGHSLVENGEVTIK